MTRITVVESLEIFSVEHGLPSPLIVDDHNGRNCFMYSLDKSRRYAYSLTWDQSLPHVLWVMLNPGTGETEGRRRNTFERCKKWSIEQGYGGLIFGNVFSLRSKSAEDLLRLQYSEDELNSIALSFLTNLASDTIVAWGNHGAKSHLPESLRETLPNARCFGLTKTSQPRHPLYVPANSPLVAWQVVSHSAAATPKTSYKSALLEKPPSIDVLFEKATADTKDLFAELRKRVLAIDGSIEEKATKQYVAYRCPKNFVIVLVTKNRLEILLRQTRYFDPKNLVEDVPDHFRRTLSRRVYLVSMSEMNDEIALVMQSYKDVCYRKPSASADY